MPAEFDYITISTTLWPELLTHWNTENGYTRLSIVLTPSQQNVQVRNNAKMSKDLARIYVCYIDIDIYYIIRLNE